MTYRQEAEELCLSLAGTTPEISRRVIGTRWQELHPEMDEVASQPFIGGVLLRLYCEGKLIREIYHTQDAKHTYYYVYSLPRPTTEAK